MYIIKIGEPKKKCNEWEKSNVKVYVDQDWIVSAWELVGVAGKSVSRVEHIIYWKLIVAGSKKISIHVIYISSRKTLLFQNTVIEKSLYPN